MSFLDAEELSRLGLRSVGGCVKISRRAVFHGAERISIGNDSRIDDFCVLSAGLDGIELGANVHLGVMVSLIGSAAIRIGDFSGLSARASVFSASDDFSGDWLTGPTVPAAYRNVTSAPVVIGRHVIIGAGCVVLPGTTIEDGAAIGALSLVKGHLKRFRKFAGVPAKDFAPRSDQLLALEGRLRWESGSQ